MTRHLANALGLPHLDDILKDEGVIPKSHYTGDESPIPPQLDANAMIAGMERAQAISNEGKDHAQKMDTIYGETLDHAQKVMDLAYNVDPRGAPRFIEVATGLYKTALDAANSKRDAELKAKQLMLNQQKLELERRNAGEQAGAGTIDAQAIVVEDRNEIIKRLRAQAQERKGE